MNDVAVPPAAPAVAGPPEDSCVVDVAATSKPPSHILQDGRFVYLPPPTAAERKRFFERSVARHGLLEADLKKTENDDDGDEKKEESENEEKGDNSEPKVHPLAMASARLQAEGINELNRAINLSTLVNTNEFFGLSNIVDPTLEAVVVGKDSSAAATPAAAKDSPPLKAQFVLQRKRQQLQRSHDVLERHSKRLQTAVVAQSFPDQRLRQLRPTWRLVAPEHGTRALPHAPRPVEVVAGDVDVYWKSSAAASLGRVASRVPRYATVELREDFSVQPHLKAWKAKHKDDMDDAAAGDLKVMDFTTIANNNNNNNSNGSNGDSNNGPKVWTQAEPFAIADPTLGKLDADFDPKNVAMLTLQLQIEKNSTGFRQSADLEPIARSIREHGSVLEEDEQVLAGLQHSLFCAKLFESIRRELTPDTGEVGSVGGDPKAASSVVWLSTRAEESFLPPPTQMAASNTATEQLVPLCVVHCHEGEVRVRLDSEYSLCVKLVEAALSAGKADNGGNNNNSSESQSLPQQPQAAESSSGTQSPARMLVLCRALLLHAQESYHKHSLAEAKEQQEQETNNSNKTDNVHVRKQRSQLEPPRILQTCVTLGTKLLLERRVRQSLQNIQSWLATTATQSSSSSSEVDENKLQVDWLPLSAFDLYAQFTLSFRSGVWDVNIAGSSICVTSMNGDNIHRKATFHTDWELELYLKGALRRCMMA